VKTSVHGTRRRRRHLTVTELYTAADAGVGYTDAQLERSAGHAAAELHGIVLLTALAKSITDIIMAPPP